MYDVQKRVQLMIYRLYILYKQHFVTKKTARWSLFAEDVSQLHINANDNALSPPLLAR